MSNWSIDRRREYRHPVHALVRVFMDSPQTGIQAEIVDLSPGGMCLRALNLAMRPSTWLQLRIARSDGSAALAVAQVVRCRPDAIAFRFEDVTEGDRELLATPGFWSTAEAIDVRSPYF
ncbi:MAG TPA: PilZ domain-containing protein [Kofleriaceae bacterium]|nr:PilZ domain-containing protein [Kofleriaceae bacterium]